MNVLIVEKDPLVRDQIKVGLRQFPEEFTVLSGEGYAGIHLLRQHTIDLLILGVPRNSAEAKRRIDYVREVSPTVDLVVVATDSCAKELSGEKGRLDIFSFLARPVGAMDFFRLIRRVRERLHEGATGTVPTGGARSGAMPTT